LQTHSIQFGRHSGHTHSHTPSPHPQPIGGHFAVSRPKSSGNENHDKLVKEAEKWVSQTFYGEMLKQMRKSPFKSKIFDGGEGGQAFTEMFDQQLADKMSKGAGRKLVDSIVNKIEAGRAYGAASKNPKNPDLRRTSEPASAVKHRVLKPAPSPTLRARIGALP